MKIFRLCLVPIPHVLIVLIALTLATATPSFANVYTYRYRITLSVRDHGVAKKASSIVDVTETIDDYGARKAPRSCGEATPIVLQDGRVLLALSKGPPLRDWSGRYQWFGSPTGILLERLGLPTEFASHHDAGILQLPKVRNSVVFEPYEYPDLVIFRDAEDPRTIQRLDVDHLAGPLGDDVKIEEITLTPRSDDVTRGVLEKVLPWLNPGNDFIDGSRFGYGARRFQTAEFKSC